ncbi:MAG TPA: glycosyltransferase family 39 protein, partial [Chloroflexota bacterium]|nr:glycosyltransferase family 39 protein [Chloroflexota bacterium]
AVGRRVWLIVPAVVLALIATVVWWQQRFRTPDATRGAVLWLIGVAFAIAAIAGFWRLRSPRLTVRAAIPLLLFLLALVPRIWNQADLPYGIWFDEADSVLQARRFVQDGRYTPIADVFGRDASLFYYLVGAVLQLVHDPVLAVRGTAAVLGALNAPLVYLLGRELWGWRLGVVAGVLLALSRWHVDISRLGMTAIQGAVFATLAFWLVARAVRTQRWTDAAWAGAALALGVHGYIAFRPLPFVAIVLIAYAALQYRWRPRFLASRGGILVGAFALVALPLLIFALQDPTSFNGRMTQTLIFSQDAPQAQKLADLWSNLQKHALMFHVHGDMNGRHNLPGWPMLDPLTAVLAMLGLAWLVLHLFDWRSWLLFGWGIVAMSGGVFTLPFEAPQAFRTIAVTPVLVLMTALALLLVADRLSLGRQRALMTGVSIVVAFGIGLLNVHTFFARQMQDPTVWQSFSTRETILMHAAQEGQYEAILGSPTIAPSAQSALLPPAQRDTIRALDPTTDLPYRGAGPALIALETEHDAALVDEIMRLYPEARRVPIAHPAATQPIVEEVILDRDLLVRHQGAVQTDVGWRALLAVETPGEYRLVAPSGQLSVDGSALANPADVELARGNHSLEVRGQLPQGQQLELLWQPPGTSELRPIDARALFPPGEGGTGLAVTFFPTQNFDGEPRDRLIDPLVAHYFHTNPLRRFTFDPHNSWSAEWLGRLQVPTTGTYRFDA